MAKNVDLLNAKNAKKAEFYTQFEKKNSTILEAGIAL